MDFKHKELKEVLNISFQNRCRISGAGYCSSENIRWTIYQKNQRWPLFSSAPLLPPLPKEGILMSA